jgi:hypothetical protein
MHTQLPMGGCLVAATSLIIWTGAARAQPPDAMTYMALDNPIIACDTHDQMAEIVQAMKDGKLKEKLTEHAAIRDDKGEPVCRDSPLLAMIFGDSEHMAASKTTTGLSTFGSPM